MRNGFSLLVLLGAALGACDGTGSDGADAGLGGAAAGGSGGEVTGGSGGGAGGVIAGGAGGSGGLITGGAGGSGGVITGGAGGSGGVITGGSGGGGGEIVGGSGGGGGEIVGGSGGGIVGGSGGGGAGGGGGGECLPDDCGPVPPVAPCPDGNGPQVICEHQADGACGWTVTPCGPEGACGGFIGGVCSDTQYCDYPDGAFCGAADASGLCVERPQACPEIYAPVCGCDGNDYDNECFAAGNGVDVSFPGTCAEPLCPPDACGVPPPFACPDGSIPPMSCGPTPDGACGWNIEPCPGEACGMDECGPPPRVAACPDGSGPPMSCDRSADGFCGWNVGPCPDVACAPDACGPPPPVAACPGGIGPSVTCEAGPDGVCGWNIGPCPLPPAGQVCGGRAGNTCAETQFCDFANFGCDWADASGTCQERPQFCPAVFAPVCGCDGVTYDNDCTAQANGTDAAADGPCGP